MLQFLITLKMFKKFKIEFTILLNHLNLISAMPSKSQKFKIYLFNFFLSFLIRTILISVLHVSGAGILPSYMLGKYNSQLIVMCIPLFPYFPIFCFQGSNLTQCVDKNCFQNCFFLNMCFILSFSKHVLHSNIF